MRDLLLCLFSSLNLVLFTFIGLNYDAFQSILTYQPPTAQPVFALPDSSTPPPVLKTLSKQQQSQAHKTAWDGQLIIPKIELSIPLSWRKDASADDIQLRLQQGAVSFTPLDPSASETPTIIFAHSSDYAWNNNPYRSAFALLPQLVPGDTISIIKNQRLYEYQVDSTLITEPGLTELTSQASSSHRLVLSTCYPIGFFSKRYNVIASPLQVGPQISPENQPASKTLSKPQSI